MTYVKIRQDVPFETVREKILYTMVGAYLSIPNFEAPKGGLKRLILNHTAHGLSSVQKVWDALTSAGYLKIRRAPISDNRFSYNYKLLSEPDTKTPALDNYTVARARKEYGNGSPGYIEPDDQYMTISRDVLLDADLTDNAKWVWVCIRDQKEWYDRHPSKCLTKDAIQIRSGLGADAFRRAWRQLKDAGYLRLRRVYDKERGRIRYDYILSEHKQGGSNPDTLSAVLPSRGDPMTIASSRPEELPDKSRDFDAVLTAIKQKINYVGLIKHSRKNENICRLVDAVVNLAAEIVCTPEEAVIVSGVAVNTDELRKRLIRLNNGQVRRIVTRLSAARYSGADADRAMLLSTVVDEL